MTQRCDLQSVASKQESKGSLLWRWVKKPISWILALVAATVAATAPVVVERVLQNHYAPHLSGPNDSAAGTQAIVHSTVELRGRVMDSSGVPIPGALINVDELPLTSTDGKGEFYVLTPAQESPVRYAVRAEGYRERIELVTPDTRDQELLEIRLERTGN
jgi:hypothetical protein